MSQQNCEFNSSSKNWDNSRTFLICDLRKKFARHGLYLFNSNRSRVSKFHYEISATSSPAHLFTIRFSHLFKIALGAYSTEHVSSMLHHGSLGWVHSKECYFICTYTSLAFFGFSSKNLCFCNFHLFFFWWSIEFPQQNINHLETRIGDKK